MHRLFFASFLIAFYYIALEADAENPWAGWTFNVMAENDMFGSDTDRHYTHGTRFSAAAPPGEVPDWLKDIAVTWPLFAGDGDMRASYALGQNLYTPADITIADPLQMDRPYAAWLYGSMGLVSDRGRSVDNFELQLGMVGPAALGEPTQKFVHKVVDSPEPQGWDHQLRNEPGIVLSYDHRIRRFMTFKLGIADFEIDTSPYVGFSLGNVYTHAETGAVFRFGQDLSKDRGGPPRIRPSLPGSDYYSRVDGLSWYFFAGGGVRAVARNIFLDGNTFADSYSADKNPFVGDMQVGFALRYKDFRLAYTQVIRTKEFKDQQLPDRFGAITLSYQF